MVEYLEALKSNSVNGIGFVSSQGVEFVPYSTFYKKVYNTLGSLQERGLRKGDELIVQTEDNKEFLYLFWSCLLGGIVPVPVTFGGQGLHLEKLRSIWKVLKRPFLATSGDQFERIRKSDAGGDSSFLRRIVTRFVNSSEVTTGSIKGQPERSKRLDTAYIQFSSGSTGRPKGVVLTHDNLIANTRDIARRSRITQHDSALSWMPLSHDMGLICFHLTQVTCGTNHYIMPTAQFIRNPVSWMAYASSLRCTLLYSPNFGLQYFNEAIQKKIFEWDLSAVRLIYCGAEPINTGICQSFFQSLAGYWLNERSFFPGYGLAEASVAVTLPDPNDPLKEYIVGRHSLNIGNRVEYLDNPVDMDQPRFVEVGYVMDSTRLRIVTNSNRLLPEDHIGHIQIKGRSVTRGYYPNGRRGTFTGDGWLKTGDLGFVHNNRLVITGRYKNLIIVNGQNYYPQDIENSVCDSVKEVLPGHIAVVGYAANGTEGIVVFVNFRQETAKFSPLARKIKAAIDANFGLPVLQVLPIRKIPKTTSGKVQHFQLRQLYENSIATESASDQPTLDQSNILERISLFVKERTGIRPAFDDNLYQVGLSSLQLMALNGVITASNLEIDLPALLEDPTLTNISKLLRTSGTPQAGDRHKLEYPLTPGQQRVWIDQQTHPFSPKWNISIGRKIIGPLDRQRFTAAILAAIYDNDQLNVSFHDTSEGLVQRIARQLWDDKIQWVEVGDVPSATLQARIEDECRLASSVVFDTSRAPLWRIRLIKISDNEHILLLSVHHLIADGWSMKVWSDAVINNYNGNNKAAQPEPRYTYQDFVNSQSALQGTGSYLARLKEAPWVAPPLNFSVPSGAPAEIGQATALYDKETSAILRSIAVHSKTTLFPVLTAVLTTLIYKYTGQNDFMLVSDSAGRRTSDEQSVIGYMLSLLLIRVRPAGGKKFSELVNDIFEETRSAMANPYPIEAMIGQDTGHSLPGVLVLLQNFDDDIPFVRSEGLTVQNVELPVLDIPVDYQFEFVQDRELLKLRFHYRRNKIDDTTAGRLVQHINIIIRQVGRNLNAKLSEISIVDARELQELLDINTPPVTRPFRSITEIIKEQARKTPEAIAVKDKSIRLTYSELMSLSATVADSLIAYGIRDGEPVAVCMSRSADVVVALLGILESGASFVPVDPELPHQRRQSIVGAANARYMICSDEYDFRPTEGAVVVSFHSLLKSVPGAVRRMTYGGDSTAYIMFTSGSSGMPKGVVISHNSLADYCMTFADLAALSTLDTVIHQSPLSFDTSVEEIFPVLSVGGCLAVSGGGGRDALQLIKELHQFEVTVLTGTPVLIEELNASKKISRHLRLVISGGERLYPHQVSNLFGKVELFNSYGPTECTVCVTFKKITDLADASLLGAPIVNREVFIIDQDLALVPNGIAGQIAIAGQGLAKGYLGEQVKDHERFVLLPATGKRVYLSGDMGRWTDNREIEFLGRFDEQFKINGHRIEPADILSVMKELDGVREAVVIPPGKGKSQSELIVFYTSERPIRYDELTEHFYDRLPYYMVPGFTIPVDHIPRFPNGKIDHKSLPSFGSDRWLQATYVAPRTEREQRIAALWTDFLETVNIGIDHSYFTLGGNSLSAVRMLNRLSTEEKVELDLRDFFQKPTIRTLERLLTPQNKGAQSVIQPVKSPAPPLLQEASYQQQSIVLQLLNCSGDAFNITVGCTLLGMLSPTRFIQSFHHICKRHPILQSRYSEVDGRVVVVPGDFREAIELIDVRSINAGNAVEIAKNEIIHHSFDVSKGNLVRGCLLQTENQRFELILSFHHLIVDGWSIHQLIHEWCLHYSDPARYLKEASGSSSPSYFDFIAYQQRRFNDIDSRAVEFWSRHLEGAQAITLDHKPAATGRRGKGGTSRIRLEAREVLGIHGRARQFEVSPMIFIQAAYIVALFRHSNSTTIPLANVFANRSEEQWDNTIGLCSNLVPLIFKVDGSTFFSQHLNSVKEVLIEAIPYQSFPLKRIQDLTDELKELPWRDLTDHIFVYQKTRQGGLLAFHDLDGIDVDKLISAYPSARQALACNVFENSDGSIDIVFEYDKAVLGDDYMSRMADHFHRLLMSVVANADQRLDKIDILGREERNAIAHWSGPELSEVPLSTLYELFELTAARNPEGIAVTSGESVISYRDLSRFSDRVAAALIDSDVKINDVVGVATLRSIECTAFLLGILKAGCTYLYLDPDLPEERKDFMLSDSRARIMLSTTDLRHRSVPTLVLETTEKHFEKPEYKTADVAYIIYTSGTTGVPKGVPTGHKGLVNAALEYRRLFSIGPGDRYLQFLSLSFDGSLLDIFAAFGGGCELVLPESTVISDPELFTKWIIKRNLSILVLTPTYIRRLNKAALPGTRILVSAGEEANVSDCLHYARSLRVFNAYGPTESAVCTTVHEVVPGKAYSKIPIGRPLRNKQVLILSDADELQPIGVAGEICIGGLGLASGYLNLDAKTRERFQTSRWASGAHVFKTGDYGYWDEEGELYFIGRNDDQVKIGAYRIEIQEIEDKLSLVPGIEFSAVIKKSDKSGDFLQAFYRSDVQLEEHSIRDMLSKSLPLYMIPRRFVFVNDWPVTSSGKTDRKALDELSVPDVAPSRILTDHESVIAEIWQQVLGHEVNSPFSHFFELGANSLQATRLVDLYRSAFGKAPALRDIFTHPLLEEHVGLIRHSKVVSEIRPVTGESKRFEVSAAQRRVWIRSKVAGNNEFNTVSAYRIKGELNDTIVSKTLSLLSERHESLRTTFVEIDDRPYQKVQTREYRAVDYRLIHLSPETVSRQQLEEIIQAENDHVFDLRNGPLIRFRLVRVTQTLHFAVLNFHHIVADGWSIPVFANEFSLIYQAIANEQAVTLPNLPFHYKDFAAWQNSQLKDDSAHVAYWKEKLLPGRTRLDLRTDFRRPKQKSTSGARKSTTLGTATTRDFEQLARQTGASIQMVTHAVFKVFLATQTSQNDIVLVTATSGRHDHNLAGQIGFYVNLLPIRTRIAYEQSFRHLVSEVRKDFIEAFEHQDISFDRIVEALDLSDDLDRSPASHVGFTWNDMDVFTGWDNFLIERYEPASVVAPNDLWFFGRTENGTIELTIEYNTDLFSDERILSFIDNLQHLSSTLGRNPEAFLSEIPLVSESEYRQLAIDYNSTRRPYPSLTVHEHFCDIAARFSDNVAVVSDGVSYTYHELADRSDFLCSELQNRFGVSKGDRVGVYAVSSGSVIIALLAILKAGAVYVTFDPSNTVSRNSVQINDAELKVLLTNSEQFLQLPENVQLPLFALDLEIESVHNVRPNPVAVSPDEPAYMIYTSGSTGRSKAVIVSHRGIMRLVVSADYIRFDQQLRILQTGSLAFDACTFEIWAPLLNGGTLYLFPVRDLLNISVLKEKIREHDINVMWFTSAWFNQLADTDATLFQPLETILVGGDKLSPPHINMVRRTTDARIVNGYGPTENTTFSACYTIPGETNEDVPLGKAIANSTVYILDRYGRVVPEGVQGELYLGGDGVALGYWKDEALSSEKFLHDPFCGNGRRLYRSGDIGYWDGEGNIRFVGRADNQVKIRGFRVELGEIEIALRQHPSVKSSFVCITELDGDKKIVCYYLSKDQSQSPLDLKAHLRDFLPGYMIPSLFVPLSVFPLTANGKVDREQLPDPWKYQVEEKLLSPETEIQKQLCAIFSNATGNGAIGIESNFFDVGGDSIRAIRAVSQINEILKASIQVKDIFTYPTVMRLEEYIQSQPRKVTSARREEIVQEMAAVHKHAVDSGVINGETCEDCYPMSDIEKGMMFHSLVLPGSGMYHDKFYYQWRDTKFDPSFFYQALILLVEKHDILRTGYILEGTDTPLHIVFQNGAFIPDYESRDISNESSSQQVSVIHEVSEHLRRKPFEQNRPGLFRVRIFKLGPGEFGFLWIFHHMILDGWSNAALLNEWLEIYESLQDGYSPVTGKLKASYKDFAIDQIIYSESERLSNFWQSELSDVGRTPLPYLRNAPPGAEYGDIITSEITLPGETCKGLGLFAKNHSVPLSQVYFSIFLYVLKVYTNCNDLLVGLVTSNRPQGTDGDKVLGCFLNTLPFRFSVPSVSNPLTLAQQVWRKRSELKEFEELSLMRISSAVNPKATQRTPLFDILFGFLDFHVLDGRLLDLKIEKEQDYVKTNTLFDFHVLHKGENWVVNVSTRQGVFDHSELSGFLASWELLASQFALYPQRKIDPISLMSPEGLQFIYTHSRGKSAPVQFESVLSKVLECGRLHGNAPAILSENRNITYTELLKEATKLSAYLTRECSPANRPIALLMPRSPEMIISIMGIWHAGFSFVPLDRQWPADRMAHVLEETKPAAVLLFSESFTSMCSLFQGHIVAVDIQLSLMEEASVEPSAGALAYTLYTSGSTGKPKGVMISHRSLANYIGWAGEFYFEDTVSTPMALCTLITFDLTITSLFTPLTRGDQIIIIPENDIEQTLISAFRPPVKAIKLTPSHVSAVGSMELHNSELSVVILGGEAVTTEHVAILRSAAPNARIFNEYGPTEATVGCMIREITASNTDIDIGRPIQNTVIAIVDDDMNILPPGVPGELILSGTCLSEGYLASSPLTVEKFFYLNGDRYYRTGDIVRWKPDGNVVFMGRKDSQVKIRGYRIELGEIENALFAIDHIREAAVVVGGQGHDRLFAYYTASESVDQDQIASNLRQKIPAYMMPDLVKLTSIPVTPNGKIDRKELIKWTIETQLPQIVFPQTEIEIKVAALFSEALNVPSIGMDQNFFQSGGDSLKAVKLVMLAQKEFQKTIELKHLFQSPTPALFIEEIERLSTPSGEIGRAPDLEFYPLSAAQRRIWFHEKLIGIPGFYSVAGAYCIRGPFDKRRAEKAFEKLIDHYEILRTGFREIKGIPMQYIVRDFRLEIGIHEQGETLDTVDESVYYSQFVDQRIAKSKSLFEVHLFNSSHEESVLLIRLHHLICDGLSISILLSAWRDFYNDVPGLAPPALQYKDFAFWEDHHSGSSNGQDSGFWNEYLKRPFEILSLPFDKQSAGPRQWTGSQIDLVLKDDVPARLQELSRICKVTLFNVFQCAVGVLMFRYTGRTEIPMWIATAGRHHPQLQDMPGVFVDTLPFRLSLQGTLSDIIRVGHQKFSEVLTHRDSYDHRPGSEPQLVVVMEDLTSRETQYHAIEGLELSEIQLIPSVCPCDLRIVFQLTSDSIRIQINYSTALFIESTITSMGRHLAHVLKVISSNPEMRFDKFELDEEKEALTNDLKTEFDFE